MQSLNVTFAEQVFRLEGSLLLLRDTLTRVQHLAEQGQAQVTHAADETLAYNKTLYQRSLNRSLTTSSSMHTVDSSAVSCS